MFTRERHRQIVDFIDKKRRASFDELRRLVKVSPATLRRDLTLLEAELRLVRVHGGVMHPQFLNGEPSFEKKSHEAVRAKQAIARAAAELIKAEATVFLDAGTTCLEVGRFLMSQKGLVIITNSAKFLHVAEGAAAKVVCVGGDLRAITGALVGSFALSWLEALRADVAVVGASGLSADEGPSTTELSEASMKQTFIRRAKSTILVADASKWQKPSCVRFASWNQIGAWVTSSDLLSPSMRHVSRKGTRVVRA
jgi:DeoR family transcriptional regulator, fructose operon transcriptional repressor